MRRASGRAQACRPAPARAPGPAPLTMSKRNSRHSIGAVPQRHAAAFLQPHQRRAASCRGSAPRPSSPRSGASSARPARRRSRPACRRLRPCARRSWSPAAPRPLGAMRSPYGGLSISVPRRRRRRALQRVAGLELDGRAHAGALGVAGGEVDHAKGHVAGEDRHRARVHARARGRLQFAPGGRLRRGTAASRSKAKRRCAARARCRRRSAPPRWRWCRRRSRGRAAAPSSARPRQPAAASIAAASVSFSGASPVSLAPAALEQRLARGVDVQRGVVGVEVQRERQVGAAGVDAGPLAGGFAQRVAHGVLDAQRGEVQALQRRALRRRVDAQRLRAA